LDVNRTIKFLEFTMPVMLQVGKTRTLRRHLGNCPFERLFGISGTETKQK
jgi:hypothetical protein